MFLVGVFGRGLWSGSMIRVNKYMKFLKVLMILTWFTTALTGCGEKVIDSGKKYSQLSEADFVSPPEQGTYSVGSSNIEVAEAFSDLGDAAMELYLAGRPDANGKVAFITDILKYPEDALITPLTIPDNEAIFGPASGKRLKVLTFVTFPTKPTEQKDSYDFPYMNSAFGTFENMLAAGEKPQFAEPDAQYPLIILSHGATAHGIYDVQHAHDLSRNGYIVAVLFYGDERTTGSDETNPHWNPLRPLMTSAVLDTLLAHPDFGPRIDKDNIGISGHSFGGFTSLALGGGEIIEGTNFADDRFSAAVIAAPWVGGVYSGKTVYAFTDENRSLANVKIPVITMFGTIDQITTAESILPATKYLAGDHYLVELIGQSHIFEGGSWMDRNSWELTFFNAYLKNDEKALKNLKTAKSMTGGNKDLQLFDY